MIETATDTYASLMSVIKEYMTDAELDVDSFTSATSLGDAGLDSLDMLKLASLISEELNLALPSTLLFDYPSVDALCSYLLATQVPLLLIICLVLYIYTNILV